MNYVTRKHFEALQYGNGNISENAEPRTRNYHLLVENPPPLQKYSAEKITASIVLQHIASRNRRSDYFEPNLFSDPAWDVLLSLYVAYLDQQKVSITDLTHLSAVAPTTVLRWIARLTEQGWLTRVEDPTDNRRVFIGMSFRGAVAMNGYFGSCGYAPTHL